MKTRFALLAFLTLLLAPGAVYAQEAAPTPLLRFLTLCETAEQQLHSHSSATATLAEAAQLIPTLPALQQPAARRELVAYFGQAGRFDAAEQQLAALHQPTLRNQALGTLIAFTIAAGDFPRTERLLPQITNPECAAVARASYFLALLRTASLFTQSLLLTANR